MRHIRALSERPGDRVVEAAHIEREQRKGPGKSYEPGEAQTQNTQRGFTPPPSEPAAGKHDGGDPGARVLNAHLPAGLATRTQKLAVNRASAANHGALTGRERGGRRLGEPVPEHDDIADRSLNSDAVVTLERQEVKGASARVSRRRRGNTEYGGHAVSMPDSHDVQGQREPNGPTPSLREKAKMREGKGR